VASSANNIQLQQAVAPSISELIPLFFDVYVQKMWSQTQTFSKIRLQALGTQTQK
jgi:hypothetical protein